MVQGFCGPILHKGVSLGISGLRIQLSGRILAQHAQGPMHQFLVHTHNKFSIFLPLWVIFLTGRRDQQRHGEAFFSKALGFQSVLPHNFINSDKEEKAICCRPVPSFDPTYSMESMIFLGSTGHGQMTSSMWLRLQLEKAVEMWMKASSFGIWLAISRSCWVAVTFSCTASLERKKQEEAVKTLSILFLLCHTLRVPPPVTGMPHCNCTYPRDRWTRL